MSGNYAIGTYKVENKSYYDTLLELEITDDKILKKLDVDGDMVLTEDELAEVDITSDGTEETANSEETASSNQQGNANTEQQVAATKEKYDKKLTALYTQLDSLESERRQYFNKAAGTSSEDLASIVSKAESLTSDIKSTRTSIAAMLAKEESDIESIYQDAANAASSAISTSTTSSSTYTLSGTSDGDVAEMMSKVSSFQKGVLIDKADYIEEVCDKYGVDPALALSIMALETGYGTSSAVVNKNNPGGYMDSATGYSTVKTFSTLEEGIEAVVRNLANGYIKQGLTSIAEIGAKYCPVGASNDKNGTNSGWVPSVTSIYNTLTGKNITSTTKIV